jgi:hypothetical protein
MRGTWLTGVTGVLTLVVAVVLMAFSAPTTQVSPGAHAQQTGTATTQSAVRSAVKHYP